jgi:serine/threonine-protein kinase
VTRALEDAWREVSHYLDEVLDLEPDARQPWLDDLETRAPESAARIRAYLRELAELDAQNFLGDPAAFAVAGATLAGQSFGAYTLDRTIGHGGMGTVWLAHRSDGRFEGQAAVKLLNTALVGHPSEQRFAREGSVLARLQHPNIAHLLDAGVAANSQPYLVLEYVQGERIDRYCEMRKLGIEQCITLFLDVLGAVAHAHTNLIVHRDLKPPNILVTDHGVVKLLDFGVAALLSPDAERGAAQLTHHVAPGLTPEYAAPEQLLGEAITTATDVYALGLVLFVLLAGRHPASPEGKTAAELMRLTLDTEVPRPSEIAIDIRQGRLLRGDLDNIIAMALRRNPAERYSNVDLFAQDLRRYLALEPVSARPRSLGYLAAKFTRRHRGSVAAAIAVLVVLVGAVVMTTLQMLEARQQRDQSQYQSRRAEASSDFLTLLMLTDLGPAHPARTFHERLELGVELINKQYRGDPKFAGRMLVELADHFRDREETGRANELYAQAYDIGRDNHDVELMAHAQCTRAYGEAYANIREGVLERIEEAQQLLEQVARPDAILQSECMYAQARVELMRGDSAAAEATLRHTLSILEADGSTHRQAYVSVLTALARIYMDRNQPRDALRLAQLAGDIHERNGRGGTTSRLTSRQNVAVALGAMGETRAELVEREIINQKVRELESAGQEPLFYPLNYASLLLRMARPAAALQALDGALARARSAGSPALLTQALFTTGSTFIQLGRWDEAEAALQEATSLAAGGFGNSNMVAQSEALLAQMDMARGNLASARRRCDKSLELAGYRTQKPQRSLAKLLRVASQVALAAGAAADAEQFARDALAISEAVARGPDTSADVGEALLRLAQAKSAIGMSQGTRTMLEHALRCLTNGLGPEHPTTREAQAALTSSR